MKKLLLISILFVFGGNCFGQVRDSLATNGTHGTPTADEYRYYRPGVYLAEAGKLGTGKYIVAGSTTLLLLMLSNNPDAGDAVPIIATLGTITYVVMDICAWSKIKKAGLATEERRKKVTLGLSPVGFNICYRF